MELWVGLDVALGQDGRIRQAKSRSLYEKLPISKRPAAVTDVQRIKVKVNIYWKHINQYIARDVNDLFDCI